MSRGGGKSDRTGRTVAPDEAELWNQVARSVDKVRSKPRVPSHVDAVEPTPAAPARVAPAPAKTEPRPRASRPAPAAPAESGPAATPCRVRSPRCPPGRVRQGRDRRAPRSARHAPARCPHRVARVPARRAGARFQDRSGHHRQGRHCCGARSSRRRVGKTAARRLAPQRAAMARRSPSCAPSCSATPVPARVTAATARFTCSCASPGRVHSGGATLAMLVSSGGRCFAGRRAHGRPGSGTELRGHRGCRRRWRAPLPPARRR